MEPPWESSTKWVWLPGYDDSRNPGSIVLFRRDFELSNTNPLSINVTADSRYRLYLNGQLISVGPCKGTPLHWHYESVNVTSHLRVGTNVLAAQVLRHSPAHRALTYIPKRFKGVAKVIETAGSSPEKVEEQWNALLIRNEPVTIPANSQVLLDIQATEYTTGYLTFAFSNGTGAHVGHLSAESYELEPRDREITRKKGNRVDFQNGYLNGVWDEYIVAGR
ncbi:hypothetical protein BHE90_007773 [Fusarium euwallaceae]|uniref:Bacterial alpha-L-rhamnosidase N-terminal domain-containing protein n=1 Tax=Fusarium euwallaceae TaxID=1147111 RepID=A0A430LPV4_9HYPO|nr:hypothetical protein BHE90_007773 [Fusarium euwallaceae]